MTGFFDHIEYVDESGEEAQVLSYQLESAEICGFFPTLGLSILMRLPYSGSPETEEELMHQLWEEAEDPQAYVAGNLIWLCSEDGLARIPLSIVHKVEFDAGEGHSNLYGYLRPEFFTSDVDMAEEDETEED